MNKKNVYLIQVSNTCNDTYYLPYSVGCIVAYAWSDPVIAQSYELKRIIFRREKIDEAVASLEQPYFVGFSNTIMTDRYDKIFAKKIKEKYPECTVAFGGKEIPIGTKYLQDFPDIDFLMFNGGEEVFKSLLLTLHEGKNDFSGIVNLAFRDASGKPVINELSNTPCCDYPSPYLTGVFDDLVQNSGYKFVAGFETTRGCPHRCAYCDWGTGKVAFAPLDKVLREIEWIGSHGIEFCACFDSNFGIYENDEVIVDKLIETKNKYGCPQKLQVATSKNETHRTFVINKKLNENRMSKGVTLSVQTLNSDALKFIGRTNVPLEKFAELMALYNSNGIPTFTDLILGLPGETYESFCDGICKLLSVGQHSAIYAYSCDVLTNTQLWQPEYMEKYKIETVAVPFNQYHCDIDCEEDIEEYSNEIVSTFSMDRQAFIDSKVFAHIVQCFHCLGLLRCFAMYLNRANGTEYLDFYKGLLSWIDSHPSSLCGVCFDDIRKQISLYTQGKRARQTVNPVFGNIMWPYEEGAFLNLLYESDRFYDEIAEYLRSYDIPDDIFEQLMRYQRDIIKMPGRNEHSAHYSFDFSAFFRDVYANKHSELERVENTTVFSSPGVPDNWFDYSRIVVWFARKGDGCLYKDITVLPD